MQDEILVNRVANSGLLTLDLEQFYPAEPFVVFDLKPYLFMELILKEKDFREALKTTDWSPYENKNVCIVCTADAIIPVWAYMLVAANLQPGAKNIFHTTPENAVTESILQNIKQTLQLEDYRDQRVVIKGCGEKPISETVYIAATAMLRPVVKSIMYGEPCSTVPVYKKK